MSTDEFEIPDIESLKRFTLTALQDYAVEAAAVFDALRDSLTQETVTDQDLDDLEDLKTFMLAVDEEIAERSNRSGRFNALMADMDDEDDEDDMDDEEEEEPTPPPFKKRGRKTEMSASKVTAASATTAAVAATTPSVAQVAAISPTPVVGEIVTSEEVLPQFKILAAADTGFSAGSELKDYVEVAKAFVARSHTHSGGTAQQSTVATIKREFGNDFAISDGDDDITIARKIDNLRDERRLPGGSLLAGAGWCAPSETIYTTCNQVTTDGLLSLPEIGARRGGIRHNQGIQFDTLFGSGTGFNILTEAQVISDTTKTCATIPCPSFVDDRLKVSALCLTGDILQNRGYPEFVSEFIQGAIASQAHNVNRQIIADIVSDSTAVSLSTAPWATDGTVLSQIMSAVEVAAVDIKYRLRLQRDSTLEVVFPYWLKAQIRADVIRRNAVHDYEVTDSMIDSLLRTRGVRAQWVYDWQDAFTSFGVSGGPNPGSDTPIVQLPTSVQFLMYPAGTWVVARQDVIRLDTIYDSTNLATNKVTQLFLEDGFRAMRFCPVSRVYTIAICPSGLTGEQHSVTC
jgi:hypothetical protein